MEIHLERQTEQKLSLSSSSSSTSSSRSSSSFHNDAYSFSGQNEDRSWNAPRLRFIDFLCDNGSEWKLAEKRFDQLSWTSVGSEPAVKWSNFAFGWHHPDNTLECASFFLKTGRRTSRNYQPNAAYFRYNLFCYCATSQFQQFKCGGDRMTQREDNRRPTTEPRNFPFNEMSRHT